MSTLIRQASIIAMDQQHGSTPFVGDILVEADRIRAIGPDLGPPAADTVIDGRDRLVMPGLVNGHLHSGEALFKGRYDNMPLELWMLYCYPILGGQPPSERLIYLRSMVVAMESLKNGVTTVVDDVYELGGQSLDQLGQVFQAYDDAGMRANISGHIMNRPFLDTIPFAHEMLPADLKARANALAVPGVNDYLDFCKAAANRFNDRSGRLRFMIAPSAPQRCTEPLMLAADELARSIGSPFHTHILETKTQAVTGPEFHGKTLIRYMHDLGLLHSGTTIAHSIWVTDDDIALMGDAGCSIVHNVISNRPSWGRRAPVSDTRRVRWKLRRRRIW